VEFERRAAREDTLFAGIDLPLPHHDPPGGRDGISRNPARADEAAACGRREVKNRSVV